MLDMTYCYEFQKPRYNFFWDMQLPVKNKMKINIFENVFALPLNGNKIFSDGGVADSNLNYISESAMIGYDNAVLMGNGYKFDSVSVEKLDGEFVYLGAIMDHWGHFLVDSCTRLYYLIENPQLMGIFLIPQGSQCRLNKNIMRFFELLNISDKIIFLNKISKITKLYIPEQSYMSGKYTSVQYLSVFKRAAGNIKPTCYDIYDKIYFSRSNYNQVLNKEIGLELIDEMFCSAGYKKIFPEEEILDNQIYYLTNCKEFAAISGTLIHNLIFSQNSNKTIYVINKTYYIIPQLFDSCKMSGGTVFFLDFFASKYPIRLGWGPFILIANQNVIKFLKDKNVDLENKSYLTRNYIAESCEAYELLYFAIKLKRNARVFISENWRDVHYFHPQLVKDWVDDHLQKLNLEKQFAVQFKSYPEIISSYSIKKNIIQDLLHKDQEYLLIYQVHLSMAGWLDETITGYAAGLLNQNYKVEALKIRFKHFSYSIFYNVYYNDRGWDTVCRNGAQAGTTGLARALNGIKIWLGDLAYDYHIEYSIYIDAWSDWARNGEEILAPDGFKALQIKLVPKI